MEQALKRNNVTPLWQGAIVKTALVESFKKLDPRHLAKNPVMFVVEVGSVVTTWFWIQGLRGGQSTRPSSMRSPLRQARSILR